MEKQTAGRTVLGTFAPKFAELNDDVLFGEVWAREGALASKTRSIITVSALISKGVIDSSLKNHLENAKKNGVTKGEMAEIITHLAFYAGWPNAWGAFRLALEVYKDDDGKDLETVRLAEVAHSIFYAPMYVAIEEGYFEEVGIDIELSLANGADKVSAAVLSGDADIGFAGSEATIYVYNGGEKDYLKTFARLTQKDGSFIVAREDIKHFTLDDLVGKTIIGGRAGHLLLNL